MNTVEQTIKGAQAAAETVALNTGRPSLLQSLLRKNLQVPVAPAEDGLTQLRANIEELADLHGRLNFLMREVSYLTKRR